MLKSKIAGSLAGIGIAGLVLVGISTPAMAAETTQTTSYSAQASPTASTNWVDSDPEWGPQDQELGSAIRMINNTGEAITVTTRNGEEVSGNKVVAPGKSMWFAAYKWGHDLDSSVTVGSDNIGLVAYNPTCGTPWVKVAGVKFEAGSEQRDITTGIHSLHVKYDGESHERVDGVERYTIQVNR